MAEKKICIFCGKPFEACTKCERKIIEYKVLYGNEPWRTVCDSAACFQMYDIVRKYGFGDIDIATAHAMLTRMGDIPDMSLRPATAEVVTKILDYKPVATEPKAVEAVNESDEPKTEKVEPTEIAKAPKQNNKTNGKSAK